MFTLTSPIWFDGHEVGVRQFVVVVDERTRVARVGRARPAGEVVALVDGDDEERVRLVDAVCGEFWKNAANASS